MTRIELEAKLGDPGTYTLKGGDKVLLIQWAIASGVPPIEANAMTAAALTNLYCDSALIRADAETQRLIHRAVMKTLETLLPGSGLNTDAIRLLIREEVESEACRLPIERVVTDVLRQMMPRPLAVTTPRGTITINGIYHYATPLVIQVIGLGQHVMLVGPAGCGKTTIGERTAEALQLPFYITSVIKDEFQLVGFLDGHGAYKPTPFRVAYEHGGIWIADEVDAWDAPALLAANSALANGLCNFPDTPYPVRRHENFRMIATANTFGTGADRLYVGRNELDAASLDRFATIEVDYDLTLERAFAQGNDRWLERIWDVRKRVTDKKIRHVVSSRAIIHGIAGLNAGISWDVCEDMYLWKGMSASDRSKVDA